MTQPWLYWVVAMLLATWIRWKNRNVTVLCTFALMSLGGLLWMNSSFNGWFGGASPGPRYLSMAFPLFGWLAAFAYEASPRWSRALGWLLMLPSIVLAALVFAWGPLASEVAPLWPFYLGRLTEEFFPHVGRSFVIYLVLFLSTLLVTMMRRTSVGSS